MNYVPRLGSYIANWPCSLVGLFLIAGTAHADFNDLLQRTPRAANYLVLVNATDIYKSALARRENWQGEHEKGLAVGGFILPPGVQRLVVASELDVEHFQPSWNSALAEVAKAPDWAKIAAREHGILDPIGGKPAIRLPGDVYLLELENQIVGMMAPANRQRVTQWAKYRGGDSLSPYLKQAAGYAQGSYSSIVLALDVQNAVSRELVRHRLEEFTSLTGSSVNLDSLASTLAGINGATLGISINESMKGKIRFDFESNVESLAPMAKTIFLEVLRRNGASIQDFESWNVSAKEKTLYLEGSLSESGLRRILSLVEIPTGDLRSNSNSTATTSTAPPSTTPESQESLIRAGSQSYFKSINKLLVDLRNERGTGNSWASQALWYEKYARKIDQLSLVGVDPALIDYAGKVTQDLRDASLAVKSVGIQGSARAKQITPQAVGVVNNYNPYYRAGGFGYGWGYGANYSSTQFDIRDISSERRAVYAQEQAKGSETVASIMNKIDQDTGAIRRAMTQKYNVDF